ncbi:enoyl-CoA hydratase family protein [Streptomyces sp. DSM 3412]|uniref:Enoyl-CoA hydratase family protein n=1 Tax=Streptomyces gottesmaniae TaxID=3075518 RepID=A0ABU2Z6H9_9ACTN|nr:enoyl-CoA hydratase family protein [Streptomyces sp. DSM 3412]MDT0571806.1 enoyl-CoA hydratase family protein [Streptomyces sp. DSM 3412]
MAELTDDVVRFRIEDGIATLTLDSPGNRNALSAALVEQVHAGLGRAAAEEGVRAIVLTHTGPTFCAGADLKEAAQGGMRQGAETLLGLLRRIVESPVPVIAHLKGNARAGGLGIVAAADIAVAPADTTFSFSEVRLGLAPAIISLTVLPRIDERAAGRYFLTGEAFDGATAESMGLLTEAPRDAAAAENVVREIVGALRLCSRQGLVESKKLTAARTREVLQQRGDAMVRLSADLFASEEAAEGMRAFRERRPPRWAPSR